MCALLCTMFASRCISYGVIYWAAAVAPTAGATGSFLDVPQARAYASESALRWSGTGGDHSLLLASSGVGVVVVIVTFTSAVTDVVGQLAGQPRRVAAALYARAASCCV